MYKGYFKFLKQSKNQHGVHSPFVFCLLTKGLYPKDKKWKTKKRRGRKKNVFLARLIAYFQPGSVFIPNQVGTVYNKDIESVPQRFVEAKDLNGSVDFIIINSTVNHLDIDYYIQLMHNDTVLVLDRRDARVETQEMWAAIVQHTTITVSIDFYSFGVAFIRSEQLKEHFILRM